jgi:hypothetical protein
MTRFVAEFWGERDVEVGTDQDRGAGRSRRQEDMEDLRQVPQD